MPDDPFRRPDRHCDLVLKGGITSGVVYPAAILELAKTYRFRDIGGASAGAIASAAAAAAELGRYSDRPGAGFPGLDRLRDVLVEPGKLIDLFRPDGPTRPLFDLFEDYLTASADPATKTTRPDTVGQVRGWVKRWAGKAKTAAVTVCLSAGLLAVVLMAAGLAPLVGAPGWLTAAAAVIVGLLLLAAAAGGLVALARARRWVADRERVYGHAWAAFAKGGFGVSTGLGVGTERLTDFLCRRLNDLAGFDPDAVLTFDHLRTAELPLPGKPAPADGINLRLMACDLSIGQPFVFPLPPGTVFLFRRSEFARLFPPAVVRHLVANQPPAPPFPIDPAHAHDLFYLPTGGRLPVIVGVRASLGHPGLFTTVPLYTVTQEYLQRYRLAGRVRAAHPLTPVPPLAPTDRHLRVNHFSDGGIVSNFPIHMFDRWFPDAPTFGIDLADELPVVLADGYEEIDASYLVCPRGLAHGSRPPCRMPVTLPRADDVPAAEWRPVETAWQLLEAVFYTAKNHRDVAQAELPSFRERIVTVRLTADEGGLNLNMPPDVVARLIDRGGEAGRLLVERFAGHAPRDRVDRLPPGVQFDQHRWVRLRVVLAHLERELRTVRDALTADGVGPDDRADEDGVEAASHIRRLLATGVVDSGRPPDAYPFPRDAGWRREALRVLRKLRRAIDDCFPPGGPPVFDSEPPTPEPVKRLVPPEGDEPV